MNRWEVRGVASEGEHDNAGDAPGAAIIELTCDVRGRIDLSVIDVLARLQLLARRSGVSLRIRAADNTGEALRSLLTLTGLDCVEQTAIEPLQAGGKTEPSE